MLIVVTPAVVATVLLATGSLVTVVMLNRRSRLKVALWWVLETKHFSSVDEWKSVSISSANQAAIVAYRTHPWTLEEPVST